MSNAIAVAEPNTNAVIDHGYSSIVGNDIEARKRIFAAVGAAEKLGDHLGETINVVDIIVMPVTAENEETGVVEEYLRTTLIDAEGKAFATGSEGVASAVRSALRIFGEPSDWPEGGLAFMPVEKKGAKYKYFTLELA